MFIPLPFFSPMDAVPGLEINTLLDYIFKFFLSSIRLSAFLISSPFLGSTGAGNCVDPDWRRNSWVLWTSLDTGQRTNSRTYARDPKCLQCGEADFGNGPSTAIQCLP